jgi:addiction module HigA family antidote
MLATKRKPATVGEILVEEFMQPMGLTQAALAEAMGVQRKHVNELCNNRRRVTAPTALILAPSSLRACSATVPTSGSTSSDAATFGRR